MKKQIDTIEFCEFCGNKFKLIKITCMGCNKIGCNECVKPLANARCYPCWEESRSEDF